MDAEFNEHTLPAAVRWLFEVNGYDVRGPIHHLGAEVDLVAEQRSGLGLQRVYIEVTVQHVDVTKYGKDLTKLVLFRDPGDQRLIVSSSGFTTSVRERAAAEGILTFTYDELFKQFERTQPYVDHVLREGEFAESLAHLEDVYEEPLFDDAHGREFATSYLQEWCTSPEPDSRWLIIVGEYGTGKSALTRVLQRRWTQEYSEGKGVPLPLRIELKDFTRQFDARALLRHFLDRNALGHIPVDFIESMIANGRVVLLLDGYDEMAQYLNVRERRACLEALAELARGGARGILTSRPNYFTEAEELRVVEVLYKKLAARTRLAEMDREVLQEEESVDKLFETFIIRRLERELKDLTPEQTINLVNRSLAGDDEGARVVVDLLGRVFRDEPGADALSLSGKPVIVSYLLEVVEELKTDASSESSGKMEIDSALLTEWQIFDLILRKLMIRDFRRTPELLPSERQEFLEALALHLTRNELKSVTELEFRALVTEVFDARIRRRLAEGVTDAVGALFDDLRSSATITRIVDRGNYLWQFSHNSLREFLLTNRVLNAHIDGVPIRDRLVITDSMQQFANSMPAEVRRAATVNLSASWSTRAPNSGLELVLQLLWPILRNDTDDDTRAALTKIAGSGLDLANTTIARLRFGGAPGTQDLQDLNATQCEFTEVDFQGAVLSGANFSYAVLDACTFASANLSGANFQHSLLQDCDVTSMSVEGADFRGMDIDSICFISTPAGPKIMHGRSLVGYLSFFGAKTDEVDDYYLFAHHPDFEIVDKICRYLVTEGWSQRHGLEQRGASARNVGLARDFVKFLVARQFAQTRGGAGNTVGATALGRNVLGTFLERKELHPDLSRFLSLNFRR